MTPDLGPTSRDEIFSSLTIEVKAVEKKVIKSSKRKISIIKKSFYLAEIYTSRVLYFECMSTDSYESSGSVDYDGIKKSVISLQNRRGKCNCFQAFIFHLYSFFFSGALLK